MHKKVQSVTDRSISFIRMIAFIFIVICHIQQYLEIEFAWWFNVGVQIFLCISGYLYGQRKIENGVAFLKKQFKKILIPYYVVIIPVIGIQFIFYSEEINIIRAIRVLLCNTTVNGGSHLWFIPTILMCYFITPFLQQYFAYGQQYFLFSVLKMTAIFGIVFGAFLRYFNPAWMTCYLLGFAMGAAVRYKAELVKKYMERGIIILSLFNVVQIVIDYVVKIEFQGIVGSLYNYWCNYNHVWLGITLFILMKNLFYKTKLFQYKGLVNVLEISDRYSYEGYLVHHFIILGPMSLMSLTRNMFFNIGLILILIAGFSFLCKKIAEWIHTVENNFLKGVI